MKDTAGREGGDVSSIGQKISLPGRIKIPLTRIFLRPGRRSGVQFNPIWNIKIFLFDAGIPPTLIGFHLI